MKIIKITLVFILTAILGGAITSGCFTGGYAPGPSLNFVYATNNGTNPGIYAYSENTSTGALSPIPGSPFPASSNPYGLTIDPLKRSVYEADFGSSPGIYAYDLNPGTGALTQITGSPFTYALAQPVAVATDLTGRFLYCTDIGSAH